MEMSRGPGKTNLELVIVKMNHECDYFDKVIEYGYDSSKSGCDYARVRFPSLVISSLVPRDPRRLVLQTWHKMCFKCWECGMALTMKNYKGFEKLPYCNSCVRKPPCARTSHARRTHVACTSHARRTHVARSVCGAIDVSTADIGAGSITVVV